MGLKLKGPSTVIFALILQMLEWLFSLKENFCHIDKKQTIKNIKINLLFSDKIILVLLLQFFFDI